MFIRLAGLCGLITPVFTLTLIFISIALSPWFSWHDNALSDMGVSATPNFFNAALLIGGLLYLVFTIGFVRWQGLHSRWHTLGAAVLIAGAVGLLLVGVFTENAGRIHYYVAATYFLATPLAYILFGMAWLRRRARLMGWLTIAAGLAALLMITVVPHKRIAVPEILATLILASWTFALGLKMLLEPTTPS